MEKPTSRDIGRYSQFGVPQFRWYLVVEELVELVDLRRICLSDVGCVS